MWGLLLALLVFIVLGVAISQTFADLVFSSVDFLWSFGVWALIIVGIFFLLGVVHALVTFIFLASNKTLLSNGDGGGITSRS